MQIFHRLVEKDLENKTAICSVCGPVKLFVKKTQGKVCCYNVERARRKKYRKSSAIYKKKDKQRRKEKRLRLKALGVIGANKNWRYRKHVKMVCESCGYKAPHPNFIDGHHRDGDRKNNHSSNIQSLCSNCHRNEHLPESERVKIIWIDPVDMAKQKALSYQLASELAELKEFYGL